MKEIKFPLLTKDQIEIRIGQIFPAKKEGDSDKASLLLYKTSRTDADILDKIVGIGNWQKRFYTLQGVGMENKMRSIVVCSVGIYDDDKKEWIWKDDSGSESNVEQDKGVCSDAFKRAAGGSSWGIGRELYSAPKIIVKIKSKYDNFFVKEIGYNANREIDKLKIINEDGVVVYTYPQTNERTQEKSEQPSQESEPRKLIKFVDHCYIKNYLMTASDEKAEDFKKWLKKNFETEDYTKLTEGQGAYVANKLREKTNG